ncbi:MAG TPA: aldose 1-epimerase family protein [Acidimicrobiales bacterium]|jgi:aldose 1-epimerase|nr:aldose 1-epimerase family protein [Acidimicrobiales bacterium]
MPQSGSPISPTGEQWVIAHGHQEAVVTEVGATLRSYTLGGNDVVDGFGPTEWSHAGRGQVLAPWPNRLGGGKYEWRGVKAQAALDEPALGNAIHGLVRWLPWRLEAHAQNVVSLGCTIRPTPGYPWSVELRCEYRLRRDGLVVTTQATGAADMAAPFGIGFHPYLTVGTETVDSATLTLPADRRLVLDTRSLPTGEVQDVSRTELDFTQGRVLGRTRLDTPFTILRRGTDGIARASLEDPTSGRGVEVWVDDRFRYLMCFTADTLEPERRRRSVAIEPMTCPPDAFRSGRDLIVLEPDESWEGSWGLRPH